MCWQTPKGDREKSKNTRCNDNARIKENQNWFIKKNDIKWKSMIIGEVSIHEELSSQMTYVQGIWMHS